MARGMFDGKGGSMAKAYDFTFTRLNGDKLPLKDLEGKAILVVNTASECGYTPQYDDLEKLWQANKDKGLVVLGVPCNQFAGQEPGTEAEIASFCSLTYDVDFPLTAKIAVKGEAIHPFYAWARAELGEAGEPKWNFHKILIGKDGRAVAGFGSRTEPLDPEITGAVKAAL
jgi:glutathione peroxidase